MNKLRHALANTINAIIIDVATEGMHFIYIFDNEGNHSKEEPFGTTSSH